MVPKRAIGSCSNSLVTRSRASSGGASSSGGHSITPGIENRKSKKIRLRRERQVTNVQLDDWKSPGGEKIVSLIDYCSGTIVNLCGMSTKCDITGSRSKLSFLTRMRWICNPGFKLTQNKRWVCWTQWRFKMAHIWNPKTDNSSGQEPVSRKSRSFSGAFRVT